MKVPMKVDYGVRALVELAQRYGSGSVQTVEIAERQSIPEPYLDQLLATLGKFGFIRSRRGPQGGHVLAKAPHEISLGMVMAGLEGQRLCWTALTSLQSVTSRGYAHSARSGGRWRTRYRVCLTPPPLRTWPIVRSGCKTGGCIISSPVIILERRRPRLELPLGRGRAWRAGSLYCW